MGDSFRKMMVLVTDTEWSAVSFCVVLAFFYIVLSLCGYAQIPSTRWIELAGLALLSVSCIFLASRVSLFDFLFDLKKIGIPILCFQAIVWFCFVVFIVLTVKTAESIPLVSAFQGADAQELSVQRGAFLKGRKGFEYLFLYIDNLFVAAILPLSLSALFLSKNRYRFCGAALFFVYSILSLQKALFFYVGLPLVYLAVQRFKLGVKQYIAILVSVFLILYTLTFLASGKLRDLVGFGPRESMSTAAAPELERAVRYFDEESYFSSKYVPKGTLDFVFWRVFAVPVFTASDTLDVFETQFKGKYFFGATSNTLAKVFRLEPVQMERHVFAHQWGWNDTANANSVFFVDAYVNFGILGVIAYSLFVGFCFRLFWKSRDEAFKSMWPIFLCLLFAGSLIGTLLSNGFLFVFMYALFFRLVDPSECKVVSRVEFLGK